jgi:ethanolamine utilization protein
MEINDSLVTMITQELLKRLQRGESLTDGTEKKEKPPLILIGGSSALSPAALAALESRFVIVAHDSLDAEFPEDASVLVTKMSIQALTRVSEGDEGCTPEGYGLLWAVLRGKKAVILEEGIAWRAFSGTMPRALLEKYCAHERVLGSYGIKIVKDADIAAVFSGGACPSSCPSQPVCTAPAAPGIKPAGKRVISERELMLACPESSGYGQIFAIGPKDILTPLAADYVTRMRIVVSRSS